jgi:hypothetical protein
MTKPLDLAKVREGDQLLHRARALDPDVRMPTLDDLQQITGKRPSGRPRGPEPTITMTVRVTESLRERLDRYLDALYTREGIHASRSAMLGHALTFFLDAKDKERQQQNERHGSAHHQ